MLSSKLLAKWQGPFEVTWQFGEVSYEVRWTVRGNTTSVREVVPVALATMVTERGAGTRGAIETPAHSTWVPCGDHLSPSQRAQITIQAKFFYLFSPLQSRKTSGVVVCSKKVVWCELKARLDSRSPTVTGAAQCWFGAPAMCQSLMDRLLYPYNAYAIAYLDDVMIDSRIYTIWELSWDPWDPRKCAIGQVEVWYLGFHFCLGQVQL